MGLRGKRGKKEEEEEETRERLLWRGRIDRERRMGEGTFAERENRGRPRWRPSSYSRGLGSGAHAGGVVCVSLGGHWPSLDNYRLVN